MKFGVREICEVVLKAKAATKIGNRIFYKNEPVIRFDTLKTSSLEGSASTTYATGGRGDTRLVAWEGERTLTFTMEDALISKESFMILSGAGLIAANSAQKSLKQHVTESTTYFELLTSSHSIDIGDETIADGIVVFLDKMPFFPQNDNLRENYAYIMGVANEDIQTEPYIPDHTLIGFVGEDAPSFDGEGLAVSLIKPDSVEPTYLGKYAIILKQHTDYLDSDKQYTPTLSALVDESGKKVDALLIDYYTEKTAGAYQIEIAPEQFGGNYYLEADTLFRDQNGSDLPATFIIPNCKVQSSFNFSMASTGDPSTFTFTLDAFPGYTRFDPTKKVLCAIQVIEESTVSSEYHRTKTEHDPAHDAVIGA